MIVVVLVLGVLVVGFACLFFRERARHQRARSDRLAARQLAVEWEHSHDGVAEFLAETKAQVDELETALAEAQQRIDELTPEEPEQADADTWGELWDALEKEPPLSRCGHCGGFHDLACPRVKRMVFDNQNRLTEVEFWPPGKWPTDSIIFPEDIPPKPSDND